MLPTPAIYLALAAAVLLVSGNNLSACVSTAVGSRAISLRRAQLLGGLGYACGLVLQGKTMAHTVALLMPDISGNLAFGMLAATVAIFVLANVTRAPISLTMALVGILVGASISRGLSYDSQIVDQTAAMWILTPIVAASASYVAVRAAANVKPRNPWGRLAAYRLLLVALSFSTAYTLGANTLGLLVGLAGYSDAALLLGVGSAVLGALTLSRGEIRRVGSELYALRYTPALATLASTTLLVEAATVLHVPLSHTQALSSGVFGAALGYRFKYLPLKPFAVVVTGWVATPVLGLLLGYLLGLSL